MRCLRAAVRRWELRSRLSVARIRCRRRYLAVRSLENQVVQTLLQVSQDLHDVLEVLAIAVLGVAGGVNCLLLRFPGELRRVEHADAADGSGNGALGWRDHLWARGKRRR